MERVKASSFRWTMDAAGDWLCIQTNKARQVLDVLKEGKPYDVEIKEHRDRRSMDANAYFWVLADRLAEKTHIPKTDIYRNYIREIGGNNETVCVTVEAADKLRSGWEHNGLGWQTETMPSKLPGCVRVVLYYGSSTYNTEQMSRLIDLIVQDCREQGIETLPPEKLAGMMEEWGCTK
nr:MAG TPA: NinB protein [Caudoviricetes sp.]